MSKQFWKTFALTVVVILTILFWIIGPILLETITIPQQPQYTSISQFSDVQPTAYYYQSMQSMVERYSCLLLRSTGGTFYPDRPLQGGELLRIVSDCSNKMDESLVNFTTKYSKAEDLSTMQDLLKKIANEVNFMER
ncbi:hypothetical protein QQ056_00090 [Oscillatoria laete-virens NRMC-F 0139]|nr:hypothetical protein [Oscillatoria laete-virens]MDL5051978.1 hypothetical protein [Oscillatoria laete-virens NRMC-F 0139]